MKTLTYKIKYLRLSMKRRHRRKACRRSRMPRENALSQIPTSLPTESATSQIPTSLPTETELRTTLFQLLTGKIKILLCRLYQRIRQLLGWSLLNESLPN